MLTAPSGTSDTFRVETALAQFVASRAAACSSTSLMACSRSGLGGARRGERVGLRVVDADRLVEAGTLEDLAGVRGGGESAPLDAGRAAAGQQAHDQRDPGGVDVARALEVQDDGVRARGRGLLPGGVERRLGAAIDVSQVRHRRGEWTLAGVHYEAALAAATEDDLATQARVTADLSLAAHDGGDPARAAELADQARELAEAAGDPAALGQAHNLLGALATEDGATEVALEHLRGSVALAERPGDTGARVAALNNLALAHRARGEHERALELTRAALDLCAAQGD